MRIVSQDRRLSVNFDSCEIWVQNRTIYRNLFGDNEVIGSYDSPERAAEVFEDIHKAYAPVYSISSNMTDDEVRDLFVGSENIKATNVINFQFNDDRDITTYENYVYYMPEK